MRTHAASSEILDEIHKNSIELLKRLTLVMQIQEQFVEFQNQLDYLQLEVSRIKKIIKISAPSES